MAAQFRGPDVPPAVSASCILWSSPVCVALRTHRLTLGARAPGRHGAQQPVARELLVALQHGGAAEQRLGGVRGGNGRRADWARELHRHGGIAQASLHS